MSTLSARGARFKRARMDDRELASLGIGYLAGESIEQLLDRFQLRDEGSLRWLVGKIAFKSWQAQRRCALAKRGESELSTQFVSCKNLCGPFVGATDDRD